MIKIKLEKLKNDNVIFRIDISEDLKENVIVKRCLFEAKISKGIKRYPYIIPMKYFIPVINNFDSEHLKFDKKSLSQFLEFSDEYDENYYYSYKANVNYMKRWRDEGCPPIYRVSIDCETKVIKKEIVFERLV